jgi:group I intron endonuclease
MAIGIYKIVHKESGKVYIGQSVDIDRRIKAHSNWIKNPTRNINRYLYNYAKKYGVDSFDFSVIEECDISMLDEREMYWFNEFKDICFNVRPTPVTNRGIKRSEEFCAENSERQKKRMSDPVKLEQHREAIRKRCKSTEWLNAMKEITKNRINNKEWLEKNQKMTSSKEVNDRRRVTNFLSGASRPVASYTKDNIFVDSYINITEASRIVNGSRGNIVSCLNNRIPTSSGFKWKYITKDEYLELNDGKILK